MLEDSNVELKQIIRSIVPLLHFNYGVDIDEKSRIVMNEFNIKRTLGENYERMKAENVTNTDEHYFREGLILLDDFQDIPCVTTLYEAICYFIYSGYAKGLSEAKKEKDTAER